MTGLSNSSQHSASYAPHTAQGQSREIDALTSRFKQDAGDIEVLCRLAAATEREVMRYVEDYRRAAVPGEAYSEGQKDVTYRARSKGYPIWVIHRAGRPLAKADDQTAALNDFFERVGLPAPRGAVDV